MAKKNYSQKRAKDFNFLTRLYQMYVIYILFVPFASLFYKIKIEGRENFDKHKPYVFAPNHISYFDPILADLACQANLACMAKIELFKNSAYLAKNLSRLGAFAVNRAKLDVSTIRTVKEVKKAGWSLGIFPQGGIRKNKKIEKITKGFTVLAKMLEYDIVPMSITGCETYNWNPFKKPTITLKMGKPISHDQEDEVIIDQWRAQVAQMTGYELTELPNKNKELELIK